MESHQILIECEHAVIRSYHKVFPVSSNLTLFDNFFTAVYRDIQNEI